MVGNTGQIAGLFLVIAAWGFAVGSRDAEELAVVMPLTAFMVLMGVSLLLLA